MDHGAIRPERRGGTAALCLGINMQWEEVGPLNHIAGISGSTICQHRGPRLKRQPQGPWRRTALQLCVEEVGPLNHMLELLETQYAITRTQTQNLYPRNLQPDGDAFLFAILTI